MTDAAKKRGYWRYTIPAAFLMLILVSLGTFPLRHTSLSYIYQVINERGPCQFFTLLTGFAILFTALFRCLRKDLKPRHMAKLALASLIPLSSGLIGHRLGLASMNAGYWEYLGGNKTMEALIGAVGNRAIGHGVSFDCILLSVVFFVFIFFPMLNAYINASVAGKTTPARPNDEPSKTPSLPRKTGIHFQHLLMIGFAALWIYLVWLVRIQKVEIEWEQQTARYAGTPALTDQLNSTGDLTIAKTYYQKRAPIGERSTVILRYDEERDVQQVMDGLMAYLESPETLFDGRTVRLVKSDDHYLWLQKLSESPHLLIYFSNTL